MPSEKIMELGVHLFQYFNKDKNIGRNGWGCCTPNGPVRPASFFMYKKCLKNSRGRPLTTAVFLDF